MLQPQFLFYRIESLDSVETDRGPISPYRLKIPQERRPVGRPEGRSPGQQGGLGWVALKQALS